MGRRSLASTRRPQILRAFEVCVLRYGLEGSSLERIAQEAGVRRSLIRHYFGNRNELTEALIEGVIERTVSVYRDVIRTAGAEGGTAALVDYLMGPAFPDKRDDALIDALMAVSHRDERLRGQLRRSTRPSSSRSSASCGVPTRRPTRPWCARRPTGSCAWPSGTRPWITWPCPPASTRMPGVPRCTSSSACRTPVRAADLASGVRRYRQKSWIRAGESGPASSSWLSRMVTAPVEGVMCAAVPVPPTQP